MTQFAALRPKYRIWGAAVLFLAAILAVLWAGSMAWKWRGTELVDFAVPIAYVSYSAVMAQVAFALLRQFRTPKDRYLRWTALAAGFFSAVVPLWGTVCDLPSFVDRPEFLIVFVSFFVTIWNLTIEGIPQQERSVAWMWESNLW